MADYNPSLLSSGLSGISEAEFQQRTAPLSPNPIVWNGAAQRYMTKAESDAYGQGPNANPDIVFGGSRVQLRPGLDPNMYDQYGTFKGSAQDYVAMNPGSRILPDGSIEIASGGSPAQTDPNVINQVRQNIAGYTRGATPTQYGARQHPLAAYMQRMLSRSQRPQYQSMFGYRPQQPYGYGYGYQQRSQQSFVPASTYGGRPSYAPYTGSLWGAPPPAVSGGVNPMLMQLMQAIFGGR